MLYFCALCGGPLTPGLRLCPCGQVFGHPVPDFDVQGEPGARYWPPRQPSSAEATFHRAQNWWSGISNKHKAAAFGVAAVLLIAMIGAGNRSDSANLPPRFEDLKPYRNPDDRLPTQVPSDAYPNSYAQSPSPNGLPAPSPQPAEMYPQQATYGNAQNPGNNVPDATESPAYTLPGSYQTSTPEAAQPQATTPMQPTTNIKLENDLEQLQRDRKTLEEHQSALQEASDLPNASAGLREDIQQDQAVVERDQDAVDQDQMGGH